jgi:hypothetical protein
VLLCSFYSTLHRPQHNHLTSRLTGLLVSKNFMILHSVWNVNVMLTRWFASSHPLNHKFSEDRMPNSSYLYISNNIGSLWGFQHVLRNYALQWDEKISFSDWLNSSPHLIMCDMWCVLMARIETTLQNLVWRKKSTPSTKIDNQAMITKLMHHIGAVLPS